MMRGNADSRSGGPRCGKASRAMSDPAPNPGSAAGRYRQIIDSARDFAILSMDTAGMISVWSAGAQRVFGWSEDEMLGRNADCIFTEEDRAAGAPQRERATALASGCASDERWHLRRDGQRFWASGELTPLHGDDGAVIGFVKVLRDRTEQMHSEARIRMLNEELEALVAQRTRERDRLWRNALDLLLVIDGEGMLRAVNPAWTSQLGYQSADLLDHHFAPFVHPDDVEATKAAVAHALQAPLVHFEVRLRHKAGGYRWYAWTAASEEQLVYANGRDITTEKRESEQWLVANQARMRLALEAGEMGAWEWDMRSDELSLLQGAATLHGMPAAGSAQRLPSISAYLDFVHPEDRPALAAAIEHARDEGSDNRVEYRIRHPNGALQWLEARGTVVRDEDGRPLRMVGVSVNVTRRKRVEQDLAFLAGASAELAGLVDPQNTLDRLAFLAVPAFADWCAVDLLDDEGRPERVAVAHVDPERVQLARDIYARFGTDPQQAIGSWAVLRSQQPHLVREVSDALLDEAIPNPDYRAYLRHLGLRSYIGVPLVAHGRAFGVVTFVSAESGRLYEQRDLELAADLARRAAVAIENARLYRTLQQSDQGKDIFLATLAHELRNPLAAISNGIGILKLAPGDLRRVEHAAAVMERQINQLRRLVDDLMDVSRIATGKVELRTEEVDLVAIVTNAVETVRPSIEAARHKLSIALPGGAMRVRADPVRLAQVFANLLSNAAKYTAEGGQIDISMESLQQEFVVRVRDNGIGIAPEMLHSIFHIFRQGAHPLERSHGGLGIGLSLVEGLVRLHGGRVEAHSEGPGRGSEFVVHLPRAPLSAAPELRPPPIPGKDAARRVLVVDDNVDAAHTVAELLRLLGHEVSIEHDGLGAVDAALRLHPEVVLLDIGLPGIDGYEAARRIRRAEGKRAMKLVALTGWGQEQDKERAYRAGFDQHCVKPVGLDQLRTMLAD